MMATPCDLEDFALGFALSEGIVATTGEFRLVDVVRGEEGVALHAAIPQGRFDALAERRRNIEGRSGCGLCGVEALQDALRPVPRVQPSLTVSPMRDPRRAGRAGAAAAAERPKRWRACGGIRPCRRPAGARGRRPPQRARQADRCARACPDRYAQRVSRHHLTRLLRDRAQGRDRWHRRRRRHFRADRPGDPHRRRGRASRWRHSRAAIRSTCTRTSNGSPAWPETGGSARGVRRDGAARRTMALNRRASQMERPS